MGGDRCMTLLRADFEERFDQIIAVAILRSSSGELEDSKRAPFSKYANPLLFIVRFLEWRSPPGTAQRAQPIGGESPSDFCYPCLSGVRPGGSVTREADMTGAAIHAVKRRTVLQVSAAMLGAGLLPASAAQAQHGGPYEFVVKDIVYRRDGDRKFLARLYQPAGTGPFPAVLQVHGGAWNDKNRTDGQNTSLDLAEAGVVVLSIDFRNAGEAPYPASLQDINYRSEEHT